MNKKTFLLIALPMTFVLWISNSASAQDWPGFLGENGAARSADKVPTTWNENENLLWKLELPGSGSSSPVVVGDRVFVTCFNESKKSFSRFVVCADKKTGQQLWSKEVPVDYLEDSYRGYIQEHGYASNTPVSDGEMLYVFFGKGGVYALDLEGNIKWNTIVGEQSSNRQWGSGASLLLHKNIVVVNASDEARAIIALDKSTGKEVWRSDSGAIDLAYGTPRVVELSDGTKEIVFSSAAKIWAMDPANGKMKWSAKTPTAGTVSPSVIVDGETLYSFGGYRSVGSISVKAGGTGDVSDSNVNWVSRTSSYVATPVLHDGKLYWIDDHGLAYSSNAADGETVYRQRVGLTGRPVYASPVLIDGKIYAVTRRAGTIVYQPGAEYVEIARNKIAGDETDFNASPAVSENRLYLRSNKALYCVGEK
ncbi:outer membrane protein assembly factor BamB family protein [Mariniblastus fucicola]|uniref:Outer membrane biogenesis protein BamB n=1 Tax=Mariniblastus fucicola TaxID=980251 RepID=A0A5B9PFM0_9BACT|nr:PQQ-binding-like beta-propeller repeat protein [Mariniblastus fucicola]QEG25238.1 outer membrane biogenesis protein BamB [Mariniblastus fucicola]